MLQPAIKQARVATERANSRAKEAAGTKREALVHCHRVVYMHASMQSQVHVACADTKIKHTCTQAHFGAHKSKRCYAARVRLLC